MRLIDADAFRRELDNHWPFTKEEQSKHGIADLAKSEVLIVLNQMPTIEERKKGEWIPYEDWYGEYYECSVCKESFTFIDSDSAPPDNLYNFCPNCGADMRGEQHG